MVFSKLFSYLYEISLSRRITDSSYSEVSSVDPTGFWGLWGSTSFIRFFLSGCSFFYLRSFRKLYPRKDSERVSTTFAASSFFYFLLFLNFRTGDRFKYSSTSRSTDFQKYTDLDFFEKVFYFLQKNINLSKKIYSS